MPTKPKAETPVVEEAEEKHQSQMFDLLRHVLLASIGAVVILEEEIEALVNKMIERGEIAEKDGKKLVKEVMDKRKGKAQKLDEQIKKDVENVLERISIPTKADVEELSQKITVLTEKVDELKKS
jgi:poly(hydroxyalkanoate) granule-associated protein